MENIKYLRVGLSGKSVIQPEHQKYGWSILSHWALCALFCHNSCVLFLWPHTHTHAEESWVFTEQHALPSDKKQQMVCLVRLLVKSACDRTISEQWQQLLTRLILFLKLVLKCNSSTHLCFFFLAWMQIFDLSLPLHCWSSLYHGLYLWTDSRQIVVK